MEFDWFAFCVDASTSVRLLKVAFIGKFHSPNISALPYYAKIDSFQVYSCEIVEK